MRLRRSAGTTFSYRVAFDLFEHEREDMRDKPVTRRRSASTRLLWGPSPMSSGLRAPEDDGEPYTSTRRLGLEGIATKRRGSRRSGGSLKRDAQIYRLRPGMRPSCQRQFRGGGRPSSAPNENFGSPVWKIHAGCAALALTLIAKSTQSSNSQESGTRIVSRQLPGSTTEHALEPSSSTRSGGGEASRGCAVPSGGAAQRRGPTITRTIRHFPELIFPPPLTQLTRLLAQSKRGGTGFAKRPNAGCRQRPKN